MAVVDVVFGLLVWTVCCVLVGLLLGRRRRTPTRIVPVARKVDNRVVSGYTRAERRAWKRRHRG